MAGSGGPRERPESRRLRCHHGWCRRWSGDRRHGLSRWLMVASDRLPPSPGERIEIPTRATRGTYRLRAFAFLLGVPLVLVNILVSSSRRGPLTPLALLIGTAISIVIPALVLIGWEEFAWVRRVDLTPEGVTFHFRFHTRAVPWVHLAPTKVPAYQGGWRVVGTFPDGRRLPFPVTVDQARAVVASPWHDAWDLTPGVRESLGLN